MKVLVTGGCGYIGSHIVWALHDRGDEVVVVDDLSTGVRTNLPAEVTLVVGDIGDTECVRDVIAAENPRATIHLAGRILPAQSLLDPLMYFDANTCKTVNLIRTMVAAGIQHCIFSSTAAVYAPSAGPIVTEQSATIPITPYGQSKLMVEEILRATGAAHPFRAAALRYFNVAGVDETHRCGPAGPNPGHLIRTAAEVALGNRRQLEVFGADYDTPDGTCVRDYIHVSDLANAHLVALDALVSGDARSFNVINCGYGQGASVLDVIAAFERVMQKPLPYLIRERRPGDAPVLVAEAERLRALGWRPSHDTLDAIISSALAWAREMGASLGERDRRVQS